MLLAGDNRSCLISGYRTPPDHVSGRSLPKCQAGKLSAGDSMDDVLLGVGKEDIAKVIDGEGCDLA